MNCTACGHENEGNRYCSRCGAELAADPQQAGRMETAAAASATGAAASAASEQLEQAKRISKQYFAYFGQVLRAPLRTAETVREEQFVNGVITLVLLSLLYPLFVYIGLSRLGFGAPPFGRVVLEPMIYFLIIFALIVGVIVLMVRVGGGSADYRSAAARFGTLLMPSVLCVAVSCLFALLNMGGTLISFFFSLGLIFLFVSVTVTVLSYRGQQQGSLDTLYVLVVANALSGYILLKVISFAVGSFGGYFRGFGGFPF